jgi:citronellol/citronellal dehydrogenase
VRSEESVQRAVDATVAEFGGIDILINNASAIMIEGTENITMKQFDLCHGVTARGTFMVTKICLPHLLKSQHAHILNMSPPLSTDPRTFTTAGPYAIAKQHMSMIVLGIAAEHPSIRANALWPKTLIGTSAVRNKSGPEYVKLTRTAEIMGLAAHMILLSKHTSGKFLFDDEIYLPNLRDFSECEVTELLPDLFI